MIKEFSYKAKIVKNFFDAQNFDFLIVGSGALLICGIPLSREPHDVDVEVICTEDQEKIFRALNGANTHIKTEYPGCPYVFKINDVLVNVWTVRKFTHEHIITYDGIKYATVSSVLKKKLSYERSKDIKDLHNIVLELLKL